MIDLLHPASEQDLNWASLSLSEKGLILMHRIQKGAPRLAVALRTLIVALLAEQSASADLTSLSSFNLITSGSLTGDSSDVQGRVLIGGTLSVNNFTFGGQLANVGGTGSTNGVFSILGSGVTNPNNNSVANSFYATNSSGGTVSNVTQNASLVSGYTNNLSNVLTSLSASYASLSNSASTTVINSGNNTVTFTASPTTIGGKSVAVFNVGSSVFSTQNTTFNLSGGTANTTYIINVTGSGAITFAGGENFNSFVNSNNSANILFNFEGATALNGITNLGASILAPDAVLNTTNSLTGGIYVQSVSNVGEIDLAKSNGTLEPGFEGYQPATVPEPASIVMVSVGGLVAGLVTLRRRATKAARVGPL